MLTEPLDPRTGALISAALIKALSEANELADAGGIGRAFRDSMCLDRDLIVQLVLDGLSPCRAEFGHE